VNPIEFRAQYLETTHPLQGTPFRKQEHVVRLETLRNFGNTCTDLDPTWDALKQEANGYRKLYIYNCAWWDTAGIKTNGYFENMCELANIAGTHPSATLLLNNDTRPFFQFPVSVGNIATVDLPARFNPSIPRRGGRKRTRKGLKKRRATRRWKRRS
jgi:hypothetical protein